MFYTPLPNFQHNSALSLTSTPLGPAARALTPPLVPPGAPKVTSVTGPNTNPAKSIPQSRDAALPSFPRPHTTTAEDTPAMASGALTSSEIPRLVNPPLQSLADILDPDGPIFFPLPTQLPPQAALNAPILIQQV